MAATSNNYVLSSHFENKRDDVLKNVVNYVFKESIQHGELDNISPSLPVYGSIRHIVNATSDEIKQTIIKCPEKGRLGPTKVLFDKNQHNVGSFSFSEDPPGLVSQSVFSTIKANTCVFEGKWQYEVMLGTKGVMQLGWATQKCSFSDEKGVGDTENSFAYDGKRQRIWNVSSYKYGDIWQSGDIISCCIDLDHHQVSFFRNGKDLGVAFDNLHVGPGIAYFPAISLTRDENITFNFGNSPFKYHQLGYRPLETPDFASLYCGIQCCTWMLRIINLNLHIKRAHSLRTLYSLTEECLLIASQHVVSKLGPLLGMPFITEKCLIPVLDDLVGMNVILEDPLTNILSRIDLEKPHLLFKYLLATLEEHELKKCLKNLALALLQQHRQSSDSLRLQTHSLVLLYVMMTHPYIRKYCLQNIFFNKVRYLNFVNLKIISNEGLENIVNVVYYENKDKTFCEGDAIQYQKSVNYIKKVVSGLESLQIAILEAFMTVEEETTFKDTSRAIFLANFRKFLKENMRLQNRQGGAFHMFVCLFHRLVALYNKLWNQEMKGEDKAIIPLHLILDGSFSFYTVDDERVGGLQSHLNKTSQKEKAAYLKKIAKKEKELNHSNCEGVNNMDITDASSHASTSHMCTQDCDFGQNSVSHFELRRSLYELLDGILWVYHIGVHGQLVKISDQVDSMYTNIDTIKELKAKLLLAQQENMSDRDLSLLIESERVMMEKVTEQCRHHAWTLAVVHSDDCQNNIYFLCRTLLNTLKSASEAGSLFSYIPSLYLDTLKDLCFTLRQYFHPQNEFDPDYQSLLTSICEFLSVQIDNSYIVYPEMKESLVYVLCKFACHQSSLKALENMNLKFCRHLVVNLLKLPEKRPTTQYHWILVRFWKGEGFAFRYSKAPHMRQLLGLKPTEVENSTPSFPLNINPNPSRLFQQYIVDVLNEMTELRTPFFNSLLDQLNWAFSELLGMLQEIQNASKLPERVFIDSKQLKKCASYFDVSVLLLRVLEMIITIAPQHFLDFSRENAELWLTRLCQLICQVLIRITSWSQCFGFIVKLEIPGLENISHFPITAAVIGVIMCLLKSTDSTEAYNSVSTRVLLKQSSFKIETLLSLINSTDVARMDEAALPSSEASSSSAQPVENSSKEFLLSNYSQEISEEELASAKAMIEYLRVTHLNMSETTVKDGDEGNICTICYAMPSITVFKPCEHNSCKTCITQYLMSKKHCFFCKAEIQKVVVMDTEEVIYDRSSSSSNNKK